MAKRKYYVVWVGRKTGIFDSWEECKNQVFGFQGAVYKSFESKELAQSSFVTGKRPIVKRRSSLRSKSVVTGDFIKNSICVDGAWNTATGVIEYQGVLTISGERIFHGGPYQDGTNNIAEFLAIVHALAYCKRHGLALPIYSDSRNAIGWVRDKLARTNHARSDRNAELFALIERAVNWLRSNSYENKVLKWETRSWGENPADFGRK